MSRETRNQGAKTTFQISSSSYNLYRPRDTYVDSIILLKLRIFLSLAHQHQDRGGAAEERVTTALVGLPCGNKMRQALLK